MSHSSLSIEEAILVLTLVFASVSKLDSSKTFDVLVTVPRNKDIETKKPNLPLTLILLVLSNLNEEIVPSKVFATSFVV
jgi:hypothetical protein